MHDRGKRIKFTVTIQDDATQAIGTRDVTEVRHSPAVFVPPTLSIAASETEILESSSTGIEFTVTSDVELTADQEVTVTIDNSEAPGLGISDSKTVTIDVDENATSIEGVIPISNTTAKEGKQTVVVSLPSSLDGFYISNTANSVTFTVHDTLNTAATGTPGIRVVQAVGANNANVVTDDKDTTATTDDTYSLSTSDVPTDGVMSGKILVADLSGLMDADGLVDAAGTDKVLGAVFGSGSDKRVSTTSDGIVLIDDANVSYQWGTVVTANDTTMFTNIDGATNPSYTVASAQIGKDIAVRVTFADDSDDEQGGPNTKERESSDSAGVSVTPTLTVTITTNVNESSGTFTVAVTSDAAVTEDGGITVPVTLDLEGPTSVTLPTSVNVTIAKDATASVDGAVTFKPVSGAQGKGIVTASLETPVAGYILNSATATATIHDNVNSDANEKPEILVVQRAGITGDPDAWVVTDDKGTTATGDDTYSLGSYSLPEYGAEAGSRARGISKSCQ